MNTQQLRSHWQSVYRNKSPLEVSWYQREPALSLEMIRRSGVGREQPIIDVGGGASALVDRLCDLGYTRVTVLDISATALECCKRRLGDKTDSVEWIEGDVTDFPLTHSFALWHDRAVFHFLTDAADRAKYVAMLRRGLAVDGQVIIATFRPGGPTKCSGLDIMQYDAESLSRELGERFRLIDQKDETHMTPRGKPQLFTYFRFAFRDRDC